MKKQPKRSPGRPPTEKGPRYVRLTIGFYPDEMELIRKVTDNPSAFIREAATKAAAHDQQRT